MSSLKYAAIRTAFELFSLPGVSPIARTLSACRGVIFTMHRVLPDVPAAFSPNAILQITPDFLEAVILRSRALGFDIISLDAAMERLKQDKPGRPFVVLTFDDAYRDNLVHALPILRKHQAPFTLYVPTGLVHGDGEIWWQALEDIMADADQLHAGADSAAIDISTVALKRKAFEQLYWEMRDIDEAARVQRVRDIAQRHHMDLKVHCRGLVMNWDELKTFAREPLCTLGAHTIKHFELAQLTEQQVTDEMLGSAKELEDQFGLEVTHFSYPIGTLRAAGPREYEIAASLGFTTAVTTRPAGLYPQNLANPLALPRISLNGYYQKRRYIDVFLTGALFSLLGRGA